MKEPNWLLLASRDPVLVVLGEDESQDSTPFTPLDNLPLRLYQGPTIEAGKRTPRCANSSSVSPVQIPDYIKDGLVEFCDRLPINLCTVREKREHKPIQGLCNTDFSPRVLGQVSL